jgi:hypothetical protein
MVEALILSPHDWDETTLQKPLDSSWPTHAPWSHNKGNLRARSCNGFRPRAILARRRSKL